MCTRLCGSRALRGPKVPAAGADPVCHPLLVNVPGLGREGCCSYDGVTRCDKVRGQHSCDYLTAPVQPAGLAEAQLRGERPRLATSLGPEGGRPLGLTVTLIDSRQDEHRASGLPPPGAGFCQQGGEGGTAPWIRTTTLRPHPECSPVPPEQKAS